jgi:hypothetical protein
MHKPCHRAVFLWPAPYRSVLYVYKACFRVYQPKSLPLPPFLVACLPESKMSNIALPSTTNDIITVLRDVLFTSIATIAPMTPQVIVVYRLSMGVTIGPTDEPSLGYRVSHASWVITSPNISSQCSCARFHIPSTPYASSGGVMGSAMTKLQGQLRRHML